MRFGCLLWFVTVALVIGGVQGLYVGLSNRTVQTMTYQEFLRQKPSSGWIEVSDARLNLLGAISESNRFTGNVKQVYIPVTSSAAGEDEGVDKIQLLLLTKDKDIVQTVKDFRAVTGGGGGLVGRLKRRVEAAKAGKKGGEAPPEKDNTEDALRFLVQNRDKVIVDRPVRGLLQFGLDSRVRDRDRIQRLDPDIAPDFAVLEDGAEPKIAMSALMLVGGLGLGGVLLAAAGRSGSARPDAATTPGDPGTPQDVATSPTA